LRSLAEDQAEGNVQIRLCEYFEKDLLNDQAEGGDVPKRVPSPQSKSEPLDFEPFE
jgi:hypothetical protein